MKLIYEKSHSGRRAGRAPQTGLPVPDVPPELRRSEPPRLPEIAEPDLLRHFTETGELVHERDRWTYQGDLAVGIPDSVREVIGHRVSRLGDPIDRLLTLGAVIGREFDAGALAAVAGMERAAVVEALTEARRAALVREAQDAPGRFTFVHALIRHTLYDELGPARRGR